METKVFLKDFCETNSPSGREHWLLPAVEKYFGNFGEITTDNLNNTYIHKKGVKSGKVLLMAHADEVFLMITEICENGFLKFRGLGIDPKTLVSQEVIIHGEEKIPGIIGIKPPHLMNDKEKEEAIPIDKLLIDTGHSKEFVEKNVHVGDYVTLKRDFIELLNDNVSCKAVDDRASIAAMYECAKELEKIKHDMDVFFICSSQEEVGSRGARAACHRVKPDIGIAIDVTFDSGKFGVTDGENKLGGGPAICLGPNLHPKLTKKIIEIAREYDIPYQIEVEGGSTGTDAWNMQVAGEGVPSLLVSIPIKYMHTSVEVVNIKDIRYTGRLIAKFIERINSEDLEGLLCF